MPNIKAAEKWARQSQKRTKRNLDTKTRLKTVYKKAAGSGESATQVESQFDKAAQKGIIHPNKAARKKSRLAKAVAKSKAAPAAVDTKPATKSGRKKSAR